jgi:hypothetical protein
MYTLVRLLVPSNEEPAPPPVRMTEARIPLVNDHTRRTWRPVQ